MLDSLVYLPVRTLDRLEEHSRWKELKALGSSNLVRASVLMPAFGYMLLLNENVHQYLTVKYDGWLLNYLPNVWRIWFLFYGSFFVALATILYSLFCPPEVKQYSSAFEMTEAEVKHKFNINEADLIQDRVKWLNDQMPLWMFPYFHAANLDFNLPISKRVNPLDHLSAYYMHLWSILNMWHRGIRCTLYVLYAVGLALIAFPAAVTFVQVTWIPVKHLFQ